MESQSFTIKDARTQPHTYNFAHYGYLANQIKRLINGEELSYDSLSLMLYTIEQLDKDAVIPSFTSPTAEEFNAAYPEPEGEPSY